MDPYDPNKRYCDVAKKLGVPCRLDAVVMEEVMRKLGTLMKPPESLPAIKQYLGNTKIGLSFFEWEHVRKVLDSEEWSAYVAKLNR